LLPIVLGGTVIDSLFRLVQQHGGIEFSIDLDAQTVAAGEDVHRFDIDGFKKHCLLNGLDDIGLTLQHADQIRAYEQHRKQTAPWLF